MRRYGVGAALITALLLATGGVWVADAAPVVREMVEVDTIWSSVSVGFCLLTHGDRQYVAYYDSNRQMAVGMRDLSEHAFSKTVLPSKQGWDSHNYITMVVDDEGYIHLSGNMHCHPLLYFRSQKPNNISTLVKMDGMVGRNEGRCTYPKFMRGPGGKLIFHYRDGSSGNGVEIYNIYDTETQQWRRFLDKPLVSGLGKCNAYPMGPRLGPDGRFHLAWVWRDTSDCASNHDISYARSPDLVNWQTVAGVPLQLPITPKDRATIVDPVPVQGGLINMGNGFGFDSKGRVVVTYHRYDDAGNDQAYAARFENDAWSVRQLTQWKHRWNFSGGGSVSCQVSVGSPESRDGGKLAIPYRHFKHGSGYLIVDDETLSLLGTEPMTPQYPAALNQVQSTFPGMLIRWAGDRGHSPEPGTRYVLRWETLGPHRDRPRKGPLPQNQTLVLYKIGQSEDD